jgi:hypothetical protein
MKTIAFAVAAALIPVTASSALADPAPAVTPAKLSTADTDLGTLLDNPGAKAVLQKYIPQMISSPQIDMARSMTLKQLQGYAGDMLTDDTLTKIDAELAKLPAQ